MPKSKTMSKRTHTQAGPVTRSRAKNKGKCSICAKIVRALKVIIDHGQQKPIVLGSLKEVMLSSNCTFHKDIIRGGRAKQHGSAMKILKDVDYFVCSFGSFKRQGCFPMGITAVCRLPDQPGVLSRIAIDLVPILRPTENQITGKVLHRHWIEHGLLNRWRLTCESKSKDDCRQAFTKKRLSGTHPVWLIDTWNLCLVDGIRANPYIALSYVWGPPDFFQTKKRDLVMLQEWHALSNPQLGIPQTIVDAFSVTQLLGLRYLWVDSLCIVQDDYGMKQAQILNMSYIFSQATITIIAEQGNTAKYGLRGFAGISQFRETSQEIVRFGKRHSVLRPAILSSSGAVWHRRGWTYQEAAFSRRRLIFSEDRVWWKCHCSSFQEDLHDPRGPGTDSSAQVDNSVSRTFNSVLPDLEGYCRQVFSYNEREFTNPEDVAPAFLGITTILTHSFNGGFIYGLPTLFFDEMLCWQPYMARCYRRQPPNSSSWVMNSIPSWSWMGWITAIAIFPWSQEHVRKVNYSDQDSTAGKNVISTIQWYSRERCSTELHALTGSRMLQAVVAEAKREDGKLPIGWHRIPYKYRSASHHEDKRPLGFEPPDFVYRHDSESRWEFWFPVPTAQDRPSPPPPLCDSLLFCKTQKVIFYIGERRLFSGRARYKLYHALLNQQQQWSGMIQLHNYEQLPPDNNNNHLSNPCELVVISEGYMIEGSLKSYGSEVITEYDSEERPKGPLGTKYEFFNVLWVEWEDGIAYRKGCGRVMKSAWEAQNPEMIDLTLG